MKTISISQEALREAVIYCPVQGGLFWAKTRSNNARIGMLAGCLRKEGYRVIRIDDILYLGHRLIWIYFNGPIPDGYEIDHIDGNPMNSRIENLRLATSSQNAYNMRRPKTNTSGFKGVGWHERTQTWRAYSRDRQKKFKHLGNYATPEEAAAAAERYRESEHMEYARHQ